MEACPRNHSPSDMAPVVRTRPKLPTLAPSVSPSSSGRDSGSPGSSNGQPEDLTGVISALGNTDFIGKYSRRRRSGAPSPVPPSTAMSPASPIVSPGGATPPHDGRGMGTVTLTRMRSIRLKLEKVKERQEQQEGGSRAGIKEEESSKLSIGSSRQANSPGSRSQRSDDSHTSSNTTTTEHAQNNNNTRKPSGPGDSSEIPCSTPNLTMTTLAGHASPPHRDPSRKRSPRRVDTSTCAHADGVRSDTPELSVTEHNGDADVGGSLPQVTHCYILEETQLPKAEFKAVDMDIDEGVGDTDIDSDLSVSVPSLPQSHPSDSEEACIGTFTVQKKHGGSVKSPRFLTHPITGSERTEPEEGGSVDSNGLCSLRHIPDENVSVIDSSASASTDSHLDTPDDQSLRDLVIRDTPERTMAQDKPEKKNGKGVKQKSKSDPSADKPSQCEGSQFTALSTTAQSTPVLSSLKDTSSQDTESDSSVKERRKSKSDDILSSKDGSSKDTSKEEASEESSHSLARSLFKPRKINRKSKRVALKQTEAKEKDKSRKGKGAAAIGIITEGEEEQREQEERADSLEDIPSSSKKRTKGFRSFTAPTSPTSLSPDHTLEKKTLTLPMSKKASSSLARSHSSASVLLHKNFSGLYSKDTRTSHQDLCSEGKFKDKAIGSYSPKLDPIFASSTLSLFDGPQEEKEKRDLIVEEFAYTERLYVETLRMLVEKYMIPMKTQGIVDSNLADDIFYKINEIYMHHATFLAFLEVALKDWTPMRCIGDHVLRTFSKQSVVDSYVSFIENFPVAEKVLDDLASKSSFQRFIEQTERETRSKLPLKAQIVKPAQRIPRYELLLKRLLEHTPTSHPDHKWLVQAEKAIHHLALQINSVKEVKVQEDMQDTLKRLELLLITDLSSPDRVYLRHDMVQVLTRKDQCCIWLFNDLMVMSCIKRKSGPVNRRATLLLQSPNGQDFVENTKHKVWLKAALDDMDMVKSESELFPRMLVDREQLEADFALLTQLSDLTAKLCCPHHMLEENVRELMNQVNRQLSEHQLKGPPPEANRVELLITNRDGVMQITTVFSSPEKKTMWETAFKEAKQKLAVMNSKRPPEFLQALQITKTRAGMQFSCAAPIEGLNARQYRDVWVCNSDGYVGHMCLLSLQPEPIVTLNTPVPGCNSRILCICAVPGVQVVKKKGKNRRNGVVSGAPNLRLSEGGKAGARGGSDSSSSSSSSEGSGDEEDQGISLKIHAESDTSDYSTPDETPKEGPFSEPARGTMWLGTEDGCLHVFRSSDNIKTTKNKLKMQQAAAILAIVHLDKKVFISLANGDVMMFRRKDDGHWDMEHAETLAIGTATHPVMRMLAVMGKLWCASKNEIRVLNITTLRVETQFVGNPESDQPLQCLACSAQGVWLAAQGSSKLQLFHATKYEHLLQISVAPAVAAKLQTADDIIRQHKTACLRITSLLTCKDFLWVGTSAGVILTLLMPKVSLATEKANITQPAVTGLVYGHTGHVRFLTCVEVPSLPGHVTKPQPSPRLGGQTPPTTSAAFSNRARKVLVISGGDGYEDFRNKANSDTVGRDDSTNHLLLWQA